MAAQAKSGGGRPGLALFAALVVVALGCWAVAYKVDNPATSILPADILAFAALVLVGLALPKGGLVFGAAAAIIVGYLLVNTVGPEHLGPSMAKVGALIPGPDDHGGRP